MSSLRIEVFKKKNKEKPEVLYFHGFGDVSDQRFMTSVSKMFTTLIQTAHWYFQYRKAKDFGFHEHC
jgi:predicted alpha/beta-hydrolase family hydrolase